VTQVVIAGVATSYGIESTARDAYDRGYHVTIAADAITDQTPEGHRHSLDRVLPALGETGTIAEIIALLPAPQDAHQA
jgi:nicotinamidase-related amidase